MNVSSKKHEFLNNLILVSMLVYLFFLSRRGGDTKDIISIFIMFLISIYSFKNGIKGYLIHKRDIIISIIYLILVSISYIIVDDKGNDKFYVFSHTTIFSVGFMLVLLNYKLEDKYTKYILPILLLISISSIYKGIVDVYEHLDVIKFYRIVGNTSTPKYAAELGIYLFLGLFSCIYYKNICIKIILACYTITVLILVFFTQSRGSFLAIPATIILIFTIRDWKKGLIIASITLTLMFSLLGEGFYKYQNSSIKSYHVTHYHNNFIETAVTQGSLTLIAYIIFLINLFISMVKNYLKEKARLKKYIKLLAISTFVFINFYGLIEVSFYFEKIYQLVFTIIAISFIIDNNNFKNIK